MRNMGAMLHSLNDTPGPGRELIIAPELRHIAETTANAMRAVGQGLPLDPAPLEAALEHAEKRIAELRNQGATLPLSTRDLLQFFSFFHTLRFVALDVLRHAQTPKTDNAG